MRGAGGVRGRVRGGGPGRVRRVEEEGELPSDDLLRRLEKKLLGYGGFGFFWLMFKQSLPQ